MVLHVLGQPLDGSFDEWDSKVTGEEAATVRALLRERIEQRMPLAYLLGEAWFCGLRFAVNQDVLVPRSPIAALVAQQFAPWVAPGKLGTVLDLCTGSGCIAVAVAVHSPDTMVVASDISERALAVANRNVIAHGLAGRVELIKSDLFLHMPPRRFDLIVSNPPYVPAAAISRLPLEYRAEPEVGLASGVDGLDLPLRILLDSANYLNQCGVLLCEAGESAGRLQRLLPEVPFTWLEFEQGGEGVFTMERQDLLEARERVREVMENRQDVV